MIAKKSTSKKNLPALTNAQLPTNWEEEMAKQAADVAAAEAKSGGGRSFSIKAGILSYGGNPIPGGRMKVVALASAFANRYYDEGFDPNDVQPPACFALSEDGEDMVPHEKAAKKQAESCAACPHSKWGTAVDAKGSATRGKACRNARILGLVSADGLTATTAATAEMGILTVPPTSIAAWSSYVKAVAGAYKRPPYGVVTEVAVTPDVEKQVAVTFSIVEPIRDKAILAELYARRAQALVEVLRPYEPRADEPTMGKNSRPKKSAARKPATNKKY